MKLPMAIEAVDKTFLTEALSQRWPGISILNWKVDRIIHGSATKVRLLMEYGGETGDDGGSSAPPASMWLKIGFEPHHENRANMGIYTREVNFYNHTLPLLSIPAPQCFYAYAQTDPIQGALLLEDLTLQNVRFGTATMPLSVLHAAAGLKVLATLHAQSQSRLGEIDLPVATKETQDVLFEVAEHADDYFKAPRGYAAPVSLHSSARLSAGLAVYLDLVQKSPHGVVHGDSHLNNLYVAPDDTAGFIDWQTVGLGLWAHDVAYFLVTALDTPDRRRWERELLAGYLAEWSKHGVRAPAFDEAWTLYRKAVLYPFIVWLGNSDFMQPPDVNIACYSRAGAAMIDHDTYGLLGV